MAQRAWEKISAERHSEILQALGEQKARDRQFQQYTPHASTWLNQERWQDEIVAEQRKTPRGPGSAHDGQCSQFYEGRRCPMPGNIEIAGRFYCLHHVHPENRSDPRAEHRFFQTFAKDAETVRDTVELWYGQDALGAVLEAHPEWRRQEGETRSAYAKRMQALCDSLR